jgi:hypothetical protein
VWNQAFEQHNDRLQQLDQVFENTRERTVRWQKGKQFFRNMRQHYKQQQERILLAHR